MTSSISFPRRFGVALSGACLAIAALLVVTSSTGCKPAAKTTPAPAAPPVRVPKPISVDFVPKEALFALVLDPERTFKTPKLKMPQLAEFKTLLNADTGVDLDQVEQVLVVGGLGSGLSPFYGAIMRYKAAIPRQQILQTISPAWEEVSAGDKKYQKPKAEAGSCIYFADDKTLVIAPETTLKQMLNVPADADSLVLQRLKKLDDASTILAVIDTKRLNGLLALMTASTGGKLPAPFDKPPLANFRDLLKLINDAVVKVEVSPELEISANLYSADEEKAVAANTLIGDTLKAVGEMLDEQSESAAAGTESQLSEVMKGQYNGIVRELTRTQKDNTVNLKFEGKVLAFNVNLIAPLAIAPYIKSWGDAHKEQSRTNLARIATALDAYVAAKGAYPAPGSLDASGKPLLSWRVHLLPMLGEQALYEEFHLDEPWDSAHNKPLVGRIPAVYRHPNLPATGKTHLLLPTGPATLFAGTEGPKPGTITDDKSKTIVLFETDSSKAVEWTKPGDLVLGADPLSGLRGYVTLPLNVIFADGTVGQFDFEKQGPDLPSLLSPAGGDTDARPAAPDKPATDVKASTGDKPETESKPADDAKPSA
jgi:hypothetical protein